MTSSRLWDKPYNKINLILAGIIIMIFIYSGIFSPQENKYPVQCIHEKILGKPCPTCGISHSFSEILRGNFKKAREWNRNGIPIFLFFFIQLAIRVTITFLNQKEVFPSKGILYFDIAFSLLLFIFCFRRLLPFWIYY
jgi:hypothetical protein